MATLLTRTQSNDPVLNRVQDMVELALRDIAKTIPTMGGGLVQAILGSDTSVPAATQEFVLTDWSRPAGYALVPELGLDGFENRNGIFYCTRAMKADISAALRGSNAVSGTSYTLGIKVTRGITTLKPVSAFAPGGASLGLSIAPFRFAFQVGDLVAVTVDNNHPTNALTVASLSLASGNEVARTWMQIREALS